jgi:hypothetical protein
MHCYNLEIRLGCRYSGAIKYRGTKLSKHRHGKATRSRLAKTLQPAGQSKRRPCTHKVIASPDGFPRAELQVAIPQPSAHVGRDCHPTTDALSTLQVLISTATVYPIPSLLDLNFYCCHKHFLAIRLRQATKALRPMQPSIASPRTTTGSLELH